MCCQALGFLPSPKELFHSTSDDGFGTRCVSYEVIAWIGKRWVPNPSYPPEKAPFDAKSISKDARSLNLRPTL